MYSANRGAVPYDDPVDAGLYLIKKGKTVDEPGQMLLIKNDPNYNEQWPRPLVPYERVYGVKEPQHLEPLDTALRRRQDLEVAEAEYPPEDRLPQDRVVDLLERGVGGLRS